MENREVAILHELPASGKGNLFETYLFVCPEQFSGQTKKCSL